MSDEPAFEGSSRGLGVKWPAGKLDPEAAKDLLARLIAALAG